jgi:hypothetical protein
MCALCRNEGALVPKIILQLHSSEHVGTFSFQYIKGQTRAIWPLLHRVHTYMKNGSALSLTVHTYRVVEVRPNHYDLLATNVVTV